MLQIQAMKKKPMHVTSAKHRKHVMCWKTRNQYLDNYHQAK